MLDAVYEWIQNLAFYLVVMTAVLEVLPGNEYKKYIQFFTGLVLILLVVTPVFRVTGAVEGFRAEYARQEQSLEAEVKRQKERFESADVFEFLSEEYKKEEVEEIQVGENQEPDMELDTYGE